MKVETTKPQYMVGVAYLGDRHRQSFECCSGCGVPVYGFIWTLMSSSLSGAPVICPVCAESVEQTGRVPDR